MIDDLRGQEVELDVGVCDVWTAAYEASTLQMCCRSVTCGTAQSRQRVTPFAAWSTLASADSRSLYR